MNRTIALTPAQNIIAKDRHRFRVINCGRRFGKTTLAIEEIKARGVKIPSRIAYIAPTYQQARDIAWEHLKKEVGEIALIINESRLEIKIKTEIKGKTSLIVLKGWENIETIKGLQFDFLIVDEVAMMRNFWMCWQEYIRPTLTDTKGEAMFISTPKGFNHFYDLFNLEREDKDYKSFHFTTYDNSFIPKEEIDKAREELTEDRFAQEYLADFRRSEGLVYKEFNRELHLTQQIDKEFKEIICGVDFGYTNPAAILKIGVDRDDNYYVLEEWYKTQRTTAQIIEAIKLMKPNKVYPDPAEPDRIEEIHQARINCREVSKDIVAGVDKVRELFKQNKIFIYRNCKSLIWELETYHYPDRKPDRNEEEKPVKENDHCLDALRYAIFSNKPKQESKNTRSRQKNTSLTGY